MCVCVCVCGNLSSLVSTRARRAARLSHPHLFVAAMAYGGLRLRVGCLATRDEGRERVREARWPLPAGGRGRCAMAVSVGARRARLPDSRLHLQHLSCVRIGIRNCELAFVRLVLIDDLILTIIA